MCEVCCETFNLSNHRRVKCPYCPFNACVSCVEKYTLDSADDPHCMACRKRWNREILCDNMSIKFINKTLKSRREELLFERERSLMPATQVHVETEKKKRYYEGLHARGNGKVRSLQIQRAACSALNLAVLAAEMGVTTEFDSMIERERRTCEFEKQIREIEIDMKYWIFCRDAWARPQPAAERRRFVRACPYGDCKGFLSTAWKCGLCENWACPECHEVKGLEKDVPHQCDPNSVATAKMLEKDSRNCPKCAALIFKIEGCDQMWCTQCHTPFSWQRGVIEAGRVHNPHYYDYMRARGTLEREPGDVPCGGLPGWQQVIRAFVNHTPTAEIAAIHRMYGHIQYIVMTRYVTNAIEDNRDIRIRFMIGDFTGEVFKKKLQQREKARQKKTEVRQVLEMYQTVTVDLMQAFIQHKVIATVSEEFRRLREHVNTELRAISRRYTNCAIPIISDNYLIH